MFRTKQAIFFNFLGDEICPFASHLASKGFEIVVANCDDTHQSFKKHNVKHSFTCDAENASILSKVFANSVSKKVESTLVVAKCDPSLSSEGFEANLQLRYVCVESLLFKVLV